MTNYERFVSWLDRTYKTHAKAYSKDPVINSAFFAGMTEQATLYAEPDKVVLSQSAYKTLTDNAYGCKAAQAESERYSDQVDYLLRVLEKINSESINAEFMAQEAIDAIRADEINIANGWRNL